MDKYKKMFSVDEIYQIITEAIQKEVEAKTCYIQKHGCENTYALQKHNVRIAAFCEIYELFDTDGMMNTNKQNMPTKTISKYQIQKEKARQEAIWWALNFTNYNWTQQDILYYTDRIEKLLKRYGLVKEFKNKDIL